MASVGWPGRDGLRLAVSWLTVLPVAGPVAVDRRVASAAIRWAPAVGLALGALAAAVLDGSSALGLPPLLAGLLTVATLAVLTRGMHLDGLADTADGLGCYGPPQRALAVMRDGGAGPFAVITLLLVLGAQVAAMSTLASTPAGWLAVVLAVTSGRVAFAWCCRRGVPAARPDGLGALVADSQPRWLAPLSWLALSSASVAVVSSRPWQGPLALLLGAAAVLALSGHTTRRLGGVTGDVLGAASELSSTVALVALSAART